MIGLLFMIKIWLPITIWSLIVLILAGILIYTAMLLLLKDSFAWEIVRKGLEMLHIRKRKTVEAGIFATDENRRENEMENSITHSEDIGAEEQNTENISASDQEKNEGEDQ